MIEKKTIAPTSRTREYNYRGGKFYRVKRIGGFVYRVVRAEYLTTTFATMADAKRHINSAIVASEVAALKAAFSQWPADGIVRVGVYVDERVAA